MNAGGAERVAANLVNAWAVKGYSTALLVTYSGRGDCFYRLEQGVVLRYLSDEVSCFWRQRLTYLSRFWALRRLFRKERPDVIVSFLTNVNVAAVFATLGMNLPLIVCERTYPPQLPVGGTWNWLRRWTYPLATRVVMLTSEGMGWLQREIPGARGVVMPNPVSYPLPMSVPELQPIDVVRSDRKVLLAVGRMSEEKGFSDLIKVFASLSEQYAQWDLVILGDGPLRSVLEQQAQEAGVGARVFMPGRAGNVGVWYQRADLYVLSSRVEGFPNTLAEAMAHGCAVVSFDCDTGPRDLIRHEVDGLLVPPGDLVTLSLALGRLMQNDTLRAQLAERALSVRTRYSMQRVLGLWDQLFADIFK